MTHTLNAIKREAKHAQRLRAAGKVPAVVYGPQAGSQAITLEYMPFLKLYNEVGESTIIELSLDSGDTYRVLIQDIQYDPLNQKLVHVDLRQIDMDKEIDAEVELAFIGEPPAVKTLGGTLVKNFDAVTVRCLPKDLPSEIKVDLSVLETFDHYIHISDLKVGEGVQILDDPRETVATVVAQQEEVEEVARSVEDIEVEAKGKKEEEGADKKEAPEGKKAENKKD